MVLNILALPLAFQFTSPGPIIFQLGPLAIRWYGLLIASAVLIGVSLSQYLAQKRRVNPDLLGDLAIWLVLGAIPCARIYYVAFEWQQYAQRPEDIIAIWKGGIAIHGAILGGTIAALIFAKIQRVSFWQLADLIAPSAILGQAIGRWEISLTPKLLAVLRICPGNSIFLQTAARQPTLILNTSTPHFSTNLCGI